MERRAGPSRGPEGVGLDASPIPIATSPGPQYSPSVAFDGTNYMVAWDDHSGSWDQTYVARVNTDGSWVPDLDRELSGASAPAAADLASAASPRTACASSASTTVSIRTATPTATSVTARATTSAAHATRSASSAATATASTASQVPRSAPDRPSFGAGEDPHPGEPLLGRLGSADPREARPRDRRWPAPVGQGNPETWIPSAPDRRPALIRMVRSPQRFR
jgi:hypothetical protein